MTTHTLTLMQPRTSFMHRRTCYWNLTQAAELPSILATTAVNRLIDDTFLDVKRHKGDSITLNKYKPRVSKLHGDGVAPPLISP